MMQQQHQIVLIVLVFVNYTCFVLSACYGNVITRHIVYSVSHIYTKKRQEDNSGHLSSSMIPHVGNHLW